MIMSNTQQNDQTTINTPINITLVRNMPISMQPAIQQKKVHIQTQVQEYEQKNETSTRVIDETTLRIYFPRNPNAESLFPTTENSRLF